MPMLGDVLVDRYELESVLGSGGMATVYQAIDLRLQREVAVKVLLPGLAADPAIATRFEREARALAGSAHHGIVAVFDVEAGDPETGREPFYVMELCDGGSLADRLEASGLLPPADVVPTIAAIAEGLAAIHAQGLIHRDVKPHNILFCGDRPKLGDFGLARSERPAELTRLTEHGKTLGTLPYLAPELLGGAEPTTASDVYALGVTTYQSLTGELPRPGSSLSEMVESRSAVPPLASSVEPALGTAFDEVLAAALSVEPSARPSAHDFGTGLMAASADGPPEPAVHDDAAKTAAMAIATVPSPAQAINATTETLVIPAAPEPAAPPAPVASPPRSGGSTPLRFDAVTQRRLLAVGGGVVGLAAFVLIAALLSRSLGSSGLFDPSASIDTSPSASTDATASPSPSASSPAFAALDEVVAAIDAARGGSNGLNGNEANDLISRVGDVRAALEDGDNGEAREAAADLADKAEKVSKDLGDDRRARLLDAIDALREAIPEED